MNKQSFMILCFGALVLLAGCSSEPAKPAEKPKPPQAITGMSALYKCYTPARGWAADVQPYRLDSQPSADSNGHDGKSLNWRAGFASPAQHSAKPFTWLNGEVSPGVEDAYSAQVFNIQFLKIDSDKAFEVAQKHGGDKLLEKEADTPIIYSLEWNRQTNELVWHVIYGTDRDSAKLRVAVNASTGEFLRVEK